MASDPSGEASMKLPGTKGAPKESAFSLERLRSLTKGTSWWMVLLFVLVGPIFLLAP